MPVKVLNKNGSGTYTQVANGIYWAVDHGAQVINLSLGGDSPSATLEDAVAYAYNKGVTVVAAAGNDSSDVLAYPAAYDAYVIAVGATRYDETLSYYSNYGPSLDIVAPGGDLNVDQNGDGYKDGVLQNTFNPNTKNPSDFGYWFFQGTSMATPHVSGVAALLIANGNADVNKDGISSPDEVRSVLQNTAEDKGPTGRDNTYGYGLVNAYAALKWTSGPDTVPPTISNGKPTGTINDNTPVLEVTTNEKATCKGSIDLDKAYLDMDFTFTADAAGTSHSYQVITALVDGDYTPYVKCQDEAGNINDPSYSWTFIVDTTAPAQVTGLTATTKSSSQIDLSWNANTESDLDHYNVYQSTSSGGPYNLIASPTTNSYSDTGLKAATTYYYVVSAVDKVGNEGARSAEAFATTETSPAVMCWSADYWYLYKNNTQAAKFCKCAQGAYGYKSYSYKWAKATVYQYVDTGDNENWAVSSRSSYLPVYQVTCTNGAVYPTNKDYFYPK
jgi:hypothetical protein